MFNPGSPAQDVKRRNEEGLTSEDGSDWRAERARRFGGAHGDHAPGAPPYPPPDHTEGGRQEWRPRGHRGSGWQKKKGKGKGGNGQRTRASRSKGKQKGGGAAAAPAPKWGAARFLGARKTKGKKDSGGGSQ